MGVVFKGRHLDLQRLVAIKCLSSNGSDKGELEARFKREAQLLSALDHPNVVPLYEFLIDGNLMLIVQEYLQGQSLQELLETNSRMDWKKAVSYSKQIADGLAAVHEADIVHRDLKPGNVMLLPDDTIKIVDFGLASAPDDMTQMTKTGAVLGTPTFMAPEQLLGDELTSAVDCFSLGVMLYFMLTKTHPHEDEDVLTFMRNRVSKKAPPVGSICKRVLPQKLAELTDALLLANPKNRPTARECSDILSSCKGQKVDLLSPQRRRVSSVVTLSTNEPKTLPKALFFVFLLSAFSFFYWKTSSKPTGQKTNVIELIKAEVHQVGTRNAKFIIEASQECRAAVLLFDIKDQKKLPTVTGKKAAKSWTLLASELRPKRKYKIEFRLRNRGVDIARKESLLTTKALIAKATIDIPPIMGKPIIGEKPSLLFSGVTNDHGQLFFTVNGQGIGLYDLQKETLLWQRKGFSGGGRPRFIKDRIICLTMDEVLAAYSAKDGKQLWKYAFRSNMAPGLCIGQGLAVLLERHQGLRAVDLASGHIAWRVSDTLLAPPIVCDDKYVFARTEFLKTQLYDIKTGKQVTPFRMFVRKMHPEEWLIEGREHICCFANGELIILNPFDRQILQRQYKLQFANMCTTKKYLYLLSHVPSKVTAVERNNGHIIWQTSLPQITRKRNVIKLLDGLILVVDRQGGFFCLDAKTGRLLYSLECPVISEFGCQQHNNRVFFARTKPLALYSLPLF